MIEIGRSKIVKVRTKDKATGRLVAKLGTDGQQEERIVSDEIWRETKGSLDGHHGSDRNRKLIAGFIDGDMLVLRPKGRRKEERGSLFDIFDWMIRSRISRQNLEKARNTKKAKAHQRAIRRIRAADRRLRRPL